MSIPIIDLKKLITSIVLDTRSHGYVCDATVSRYPTYIDKFTDEEIEIVVPNLTRVELKGLPDNKTCRIYSEYTNFYLYSLQTIAYTQERENPLISVCFSSGWKIRMVLLEANTYKIIRNDFVSILETKLEDLYKKQYKYARS